MKPQKWNPIFFLYNQLAIFKYNKLDCFDIVFGYKIRLFFCNQNLDLSLGWLLFEIMCIFPSLAEDYHKKEIHQLKSSHDETVSVSRGTTLSSLSFCILIFLSLTENQNISTCIFFF